MPRSREEDFWRNTSILQFLTSKWHVPLVLVVKKFLISCLLTLQMLNSKFDKDWSNSSCEKHVNARLTTDDDGGQPIAVCYQGESGDLIIILLVVEKAFQKWILVTITKEITHTIEKLISIVVENAFRK